MASLGKDLAYIREEKNISLDDIYEVTKIPKRILHSIEDDSIFRDFEENPTYIRSYIRSYAKALSIEEKEIVYALNKKEKNDYSGSLQKLLKKKPPQGFQFDEEEEKQSAEESEEDAKADNAETTSESENNEPDTSDEKLPSQKASEKPNVRSVDWADMGRQFQPLKTAQSRTWVGIFVILLLLIGGGSAFYFYYYSPTPANTDNEDAVVQQKTPKPVSTDSLELNVVSPESDDTSQVNANGDASAIQNKPLQALPDTLDLVLYAAYGKLEPVRVSTDIMDDINPYWIEQGEALRFGFVNDIQIRGQFSRMVLLFNGHVIQNFREDFYDPETRLLEINRSYFEEDPQWLQPAPDSLDIDAPAPTVIQERPTFN